jgi:xylan 1,4-beta-xylosidase
VSIENPVLRGFRPDPCICRVGADFYIATSTFEWAPGVEIHHSRNLSDWRLLGRVLDRESQLALEGIPNSGGVWAPHLSWDGSRFYLVYTICYGLTRPWRDFENRIVTADRIAGPWSDPVVATGWGFDPSLFHDDDGRKYLLHTAWDGRKPGTGIFYGILCHEVFTRENQWQLGEPRRIWQGTDLGLVEGSHLIKKDGWYYLVCAEGGTGYDHAVSMARSRHIEGPYEVHPGNPLLTSRGDDSLPLQRAGHGSLAPAFTQDEWVLAHLCGRPVDRGPEQVPRYRCIMGRETALQSVIWREGEWPVLKQGGNRPSREVCFADAPEANEVLQASIPAALPMEFQTLRRMPDSEWVRMEERTLRLRGGGSLDSCFRQALVARRIESLKHRWHATVRFVPATFQQRAGIVYYYDRNNYYAFAKCGAEDGAELRLFWKQEDRYEDSFIAKLEGSQEVVELAARLDGVDLSFRWKTTGKWSEAPGIFDASTLSDEFGSTSPFTGAFVGVFCMDTSEYAAWAGFQNLSYAEDGFVPTC